MCQIVIITESILTNKGKNVLPFLHTFFSTSFCLRVGHWPWTFLFLMPLLPHSGVNESQ